MRTLLLALLLPVAALADEPRTADTAHPRTKDYSWMSVETWKGKHERTLKLGKRPIDLLFLGDSITEGWDGVPELWKKYFGDSSPANFGIGGDTTDNVLWRITKGGALEGLRPKGVVLLIGVNNLNLPRDSAADTAKGIIAVVKELRAKLPEARILVLGVFPCDPKADSSTRKKIIEANAAVSAFVAKQEKVKFLDFGDKFLDKDGSIPKELMPDSLHLSPKGYEIWGEAIEGEVASMMNFEKK